MQNSVAATEQTAADRLAAAMDRYGITITSEFIPFSKSRNAKPGDNGKVWRSLNWRVTLNVATLQSEVDPQKVRAILTTDYSAGEAHCPAYKQPPKFDSGKVDPYGKSQCVRASNHQRQRYLIEEWNESGKPALDKIADAVIDLLASLDEARADLMLAKDITAVDAFASHTSGQVIGLLRDLLATQRRELDAAGGNVDDMMLDIEGLEGEHARWDARWKARKAVQP